jgi:hypothetical protein
MVVGSIDGSPMVMCLGLPVGYSNNQAFHVKLYLHHLIIPYPINVQDHATSKATKLRR